jgi:hypothetical protein
MFIRQQRSACLILCSSYAEDEKHRLMSVTLASFNKLLTQLVNIARLALCILGILCILGVTAVRNFLKIINSFMVWVFSDVWRLICSPNTSIFQGTVNVSNFFKITYLFISCGYLRICPQFTYQMFGATLPRYAERYISPSQWVIYFQHALAQPQNFDANHPSKTYTGNSEGKIPRALSFAT